jgi:formylmethanofuran dehydrogenase subunit E
MAKIVLKKKKKPVQTSGESEDMVECSRCGTFISTQEAYEKEGKTFCSKECLK